MPTMPTSSRQTKWAAPRKPHERRKNERDPKKYNNRTWKTMSAKNRQNNPVCECCDFIGITKQASVTDHIIPVEMGGSMHDPRNHASLCDYEKGACHARKSGMEAKGQPIVPFILNEWGDKIPLDREMLFKVLSKGVGG